MKIFAPPIFPDDEDKTRKARYANAIALTLIFIILGYEIGARVIRGYTRPNILDLILITTCHYPPRRIGYFKTRLSTELLRFCLWF